MRHVVIVALLSLGIVWAGGCKKKTALEPPKNVVASQPEKPALARDPAAAGVDLEALAEKLVKQCAAVREGEIVWVSGGPKSLELAENIAVNVRKAGAHPIMGYWSDRLTKRMLFDVPSQYDTQTPLAALKLGGLLAAEIHVEFQEDESLLAGAPVERRAAQAKAFEAVDKVFARRGVRQIYLGNDLYPTESRAKRYGVSQEALAKIFWDGVNVDYAKLVATADKVKTMFAGAKEVRITNPNGTDLKVRIQGRTPHANDGVISEEDKKGGFGAVQALLPAGEVYTTVVPGTAEGKLVFDRHFYQGNEIQGLTLTFQKGKLTSMTAKSGLEPLKAYYDKAGEGKDAFGAVDVGINPNVRIVPGSRMVAFMAAGMVAVGAGNDSWAGGDNYVGFGLYGFIPGSTLKVDEKVVVENGALKL
jgi:leucyl aminopeptidase (aminopeptidase T)